MMVNAGIIGMDTGTSTDFEVLNLVARPCEFSNRAILAL